MYTGNTRGLFTSFIGLAVYPCVYREHAGEFKARDGRPGLSLCIQGTLTVTNSPRRLLRFIPVYTGNTLSIVTSLSNVTVYPCVYREHWVMAPQNRMRLGLSLCVQGTQIFTKRLCNAERFIPVCTGNTYPAIEPLIKKPVYPCVYREHFTLQLSLRQKGGLSLCVQGTRLIRGQSLTGFRFIPVCTGNTCQNCPSNSANTVYPCVYREHYPCLIMSSPSFGLSLCVQGTRKYSSSSNITSRFIPVCTGNTATD